MNCPKCGNPIAPNMKFCAKCGTAVAQVQPQQNTTPMQARPTAPREMPNVPPMQSFPVNNVQTAPDKKKNKPKKKKNIGLKITAIVLAVAVLLTGGIFIFDSVSYKKSLEGAEYIEDFPVLKQKTELTVIDSEKFPVEEYNIKVEKMKMGGVLKSGKILKNETVVDDDATTPTYNIDFKEDGNYVITLTEIVASRTQPTETTEPSTQEESTKPTNDESKDGKKDKDNKKDKDEPIVIIIEVKVDDSDENAAERVDLNKNTDDDIKDVVAVEPPKTPLELVEGTYKGSYFPGQGETGLTLTVYEEEGQHKAIFDFYSLPGRSNSESGSYYMNVTYNEETKTYVFTSYEWIKAAFMYSFVDLEGTLNGDVLSGESPTKFSVTRFDGASDTEADGSDKEPVITPTIEATEEDWKFLVTLFNVLQFYDHAYDCTNSNANESAIWDITFMLSSVYDVCSEKYGFPKREFCNNMEVEKDPQNKYSDTAKYEGYVKYDADAVDWIVRNIYNTEPTKTEFVEKQEMYYDTGTVLEDYWHWYRDGSYYYVPWMATGEEHGPETTIVSKKEISDGRYEIYANTQFLEFDGIITSEYKYKIIVNLNEVDGKKVWNFEKWETIESFPENP